MRFPGQNFLIFLRKNTKLNPAPDREDKKVHNAHEQLKKELKVFVDTPVGDFAVLVCYDFTDIALLVSYQFNYGT